MKIRIISLLIVMAILFSKEMFAAGVQVQAVGVTLNFPTSFGQPGYQMEVIPGISNSATIPTGYFSWTDYPNNSGAFYGLNTVQTQGYYSSPILMGGAPLFLRRPNLSTIGPNISTLYSWSDILMSARNSLRTFQYGDRTVGYWPTGVPNQLYSLPTVTFLPALNMFGNSTVAPIFVWNFGSQSRQITFDGSGTFVNDVLTRSQPSDAKIYPGTLPMPPHVPLYTQMLSSYAMPGYGAYYTNSVKSQTDCYFTRDNFTTYINQNQKTLDLVGGKVFLDYYYPYHNNGNGNLSTLEMLGDILPYTPSYTWRPNFSNNYTTINPNNFMQLLPGAVSGETAGVAFYGLFVSTDTNTQSALGQDLTSNMTTYTFSDGTTGQLGGGSLIYMPLFMSDPGQPYVPQGWNFATPNTVYDDKKSLMTDFSDQLGFEMNMVVVGE